MKSAEIWDELGSTYFKAGVLDKAAEAFCKAIEQNSRAGWTYGNLASIYVQQTRFADAISLYQRSLELLKNRKDQAVIWGRLGNIHHHLNEHGKAIQAYQKADEIMPRVSTPRINAILPQKTQAEAPSPEAGYGKWNISVKEDRVGEPEHPILDDFAPTVESVPPELAIFKDDLPGSEKGFEKNANVWNELGLILFKVGAYDDAIDAYLKAIALEPSYGWLYSNLGQVYATQGKLSEAVLLYEKSIKLLPTSKDKAVSWTRLGDIYRQLDQYEEAMAAYQLADALNQTVTASANEYRQLDLELIASNPDQSRNLVEIEDLAASIRMHGIIQPLIVCPNKNDPDKFQLIAGRRRLEAARQAGLKLVPVIVRGANDREVLELSINANVHSAAIDPFELASGYRQMANDFDLSIEEISERVGRSPHSVANAMKVLEQPDNAQAAGSNLATVQEMPMDDAQSDEKSVGSTQPAEENSMAAVAEPEKAGEHENQLVSPDPAPEESPVHLWYTEPDNETAVTQEDASFAGSATLLSRARMVLKANPPSRRFPTIPHFRA